MPGFPVHHQFPELAQTHVHRVSDAIQPSHPTVSSNQPHLINHLIPPCHPLLLLLSIFPSIRGFSNESVLNIRWPMYFSFNFIISPSNDYPGLISFRIDWFDLAVQGAPKSLLTQHHSSKALILWNSAFLWSKSHIHTRLLEKQ